MSHRSCCQFGLPRSGLYAVGDWYVNGMGGGWQRHYGGGLDDVRPANNGVSCFLTVEALVQERLQRALDSCRSFGATSWIQLRDPYNWLASLQCGLAKGTVIWRISDPLIPWKEYAKRCDGGENWLNYNRWFRQTEYRRSLARDFGFVVDRDGDAWRGIPSWAGGSSFDGLRCDGRAQEMAVTERYLAFAGDPAWRNRFDDETIALAERLFGLSRPW